MKVIADHPTLSTNQWQQQQLQHRLRAQKWTVPRKQRKARGEREPVLDFLFDYYPYSPAKLEQWFPGFGVDLEVNDSELIEHNAMIFSNGIQRVNPDYVLKHRRRIEFVIELLQGIDSRPATFNCFGLHEWAMVYKAPSDHIRHPDPLRLTPEKIAETVDHLGLRCTHIDAFRFFTPEASPLNNNEAGLVPTRENQIQLDQRGCLHANMDLYKYCMWLQPLLPGDLILDCFELALQTRELDMRASPYDLTEFGYSPINIETPAGRSEYATRQRAISEAAEPLRNRIREILTEIEFAGS